MTLQSSSVFAVPPRERWNALNNSRMGEIRNFDSQLFFKAFKLRENPFSGTPNPRFLFPSDTHVEARSSLIVGVESGVGFQTLIAAPGMGKTTLLFDLLDRFKNVANTAFMFQVYSDPCDFLRSLIRELGVSSHGRDTGDLLGEMNDLLTRGRQAQKRTVVVVDEAQNLSDSILETVRVLSNFETASSKLLQIVLSGQPQLARKLASPDLAQLQQRVSIRLTLRPLDQNETRRYIEYRLKKAGYDGEELFAPNAVQLIQQQSGGIPRDINTLCFNSLLLIRALGQSRVEADTVREVADDLKLENALPPSDQCQNTVTHTAAVAEPRRSSAPAPASPVQNRRSNPPPKFLTLAAAAEHVATLTGAEGVAILLPEDDELVCREKIGIIGPDSGSRVNESMGMAGLCMKTSAIQICRDTGNDVRVDPALCHSQGIGSFVYVPVLSDAAMVGMVGLFSSHIAAFDVFARNDFERLMHEIGPILKAESSAYCPKDSRPGPDIVASSEQAPSIDKHEPAMSSAVPPKAQFVRPVKASEEKNPPSRNALRIATASLCLIAGCAAAVSYVEIPALRSAIDATVQHLAPQGTVNRSQAVAPTTKAEEAWPYPYDVIRPEDAMRLIGAGDPMSSGDTLEKVRALANSGQVTMQCELALRYVTGAGVPQDLSIAFDYFKRAAEHGSATGQWKLGLLYLNGLGTASDPPQGAKWIQRAANQGKIQAQLALSQLYFIGVGLPRDLTRSYTWAKIAAASLQSGQSPKLDLIRAQLSEDQVANSNKRIAWWQQRRPREHSSAPAGQSGSTDLQQ